MTVKELIQALGKFDLDSAPDMDPLRPMVVIYREVDQGIWEFDEPILAYNEHGDVEIS